MVIDDSLQPGRLLYIYIKFNYSTNKSRKRVIYLGIDGDNDPLFLKICSEKPIKDYYLINQSNYPKALRYDSYIDCGQVYTKVITESELSRAINYDNHSICECLNDNDKKQILKWTQNSKTISEIHKRIIEKALS